MNRAVIVLLVAAVPMAASCTTSTRPSPPSPQIDLTGTWRGQLAFGDTTSVMTWTLTQTGTAVRGPVLIALPNGIVLMNGSLVGTLTGSSLDYTISIGPDGIPARPGCTGQLKGTLTFTAGAPSMLSGNYSVTASTCAVPLASSGNINLSR